jgi:hypothetical protein
MPRKLIHAERGPSRAPLACCGPGRPALRWLRLLVSSSAKAGKQTRGLETSEVHRAINVLRAGTSRAPPQIVN